MAFSAHLCRFDKRRAPSEMPSPDCHANGRMGPDLSLSAGFEAVFLSNLFPDESARVSRRAAKKRNGTVRVFSEDAIINYIKNRAMMRRISAVRA